MRRTAGREADVLPTQPGGHSFETCRLFNDGADLGTTLGRRNDAKFLQCIETTTREQLGVLFVKRAHLRTVGLVHLTRDAFNVSAGENFASGGVQRLHHSGVAIDLLLSDLNEHELLVDQTFEHRRTCLLELLGRDLAHAGQCRVDLMDGNLLPAHTRRHLRRHLVGRLTVATCGKQQRARG
jgi:hypothetical protein